MNYYDNLYLDIDDSMEFGKYQGESIDIILDEDPDYIVWLIEQGVDVSAEVKQHLDRIGAR